MFNTTVQIDWGYCIPAVDPEQEEKHQKHAEPKVFHVVIGSDASGRFARR